MKNLYGLIGYRLEHSFSKQYFNQKFERENIANSYYDLFELETITEFSNLLQEKPTLKGLNVTIPYKEQIMPFLDEIDSKAKQIGSVNVIKINSEGKTKGFNSDYYGFYTSLKSILEGNRPDALILGTGGASKAVKLALKDLGIDFKLVSRDAKKGDLTYDELTNSVIKSHELLINTTPLGTFPTTQNCPDLTYQAIGAKHILYDLVYNPEITLFMQKGLAQGAKVKNGLEMLHLQAEKAWEIFQ
jgi:shikimate dehydrogenase